MRTDFTSAFSQEAAKTAHAPVTLMKIEWPALGALSPLTLNLADRGQNEGSQALVIGGVEWHAVIEELGSIDRLVGAGQLFGNSDADLGVTVVNLPTALFNPPKPFSWVFRDRPPEAATVTLYQWFEGLADIDQARIFVARIVDPIEFDESRCSFDLVDISADRGSRLLGRTLSPIDYPSLPEENIGRFAPIVIGSVDRVPGLRVRRVMETTLKTLALKTDTVLEVASTDQFPSFGTLVIDGDEVAYSGTTATLFLGVSGIDQIHYPGDTVIEKLTDHRFLLSDPDYPIQSISSVRVNGVPADPSLYTIDLPNGEVIFNQRPYTEKSVDSQILQARFDSVDAANTSVNPANALDPSKRTTFATINQASPVLSLKQTDVLPDIGRISRVLLRVEHFEEGLMPNDTLTVEIPGVGQVGTLSLPATEDTVAGGAAGATVDITHQHIEDVGVALDPLNHNHNIFFDTNIFEDTPASGLGVHSLNGNQIGQTLTLTYPSRTGDSANYVFSVDGSITAGSFPDAITIKIQATGEIIYNAQYQVGQGKVVNINKTSASVPGSPGSSLTLVVDTSGGNFGATVTINSFSRTTFSTPEGNTDSKLGTAQATRTGTIEQHASSPALEGASNPEKSSLSVVDLIDISDVISGDWNNFTDQVVQVKYNGVSDGRSAYIINVVYEISYAFQAIEYTDDITAAVQGVRDDALGTHTGTPNLLIERPDHVFRWSLLGALGFPAAEIDTASFLAAGAAYDAAISGGYRLAGVIQEKMLAEDLWREWEKNCRSHFYWDLGQARILYRPLNEVSLQFPVDKAISQNMVRVQDGQMLLRCERTSTRNIINRIDLLYNRQWSTSGYSSVETNTDADSIGKFGVREKPEEFFFNWTRHQPQAADLVSFYLKQHRQPSELVHVELFLDNLELEKGDSVSISSPTHEIGSLPALVLGAGRNLGSARALKMDSIPMTLQLLHVTIGAGAGYGLQPYGVSSYGG